MSKKYAGKNALVAAIMANAYASSLKSAEPGPKSSPIDTHTHAPHGNDRYKKRFKPVKKSKLKKSKSQSIDFDINSILKHQNRKPKHKRKSNRSSASLLSPHHEHNTNKPKRQSNNVRISRSLSPRLFKSNSIKNMNKSKSKTKTKSSSKPKTRNKKSRSAVATQSYPNAPGLQSIHSDNEADEFDDILSPKHVSFEASQRKEKLRSVLEDIFGDSDEDQDDEGEPHSNPRDDKNRLKYETQSFTLSIEEDIESFSIHLGYVLEQSPFTDFHIGFGDEHNTRTVMNNHAKTYDINTYSIGSVNAYQIYEQYVLEFGEPKTPKYLMSFAKQKGKRMSLSEAIGFVDNKHSINTLNHALSDLIYAEQDAHAQHTQQAPQLPIAYAMNGAPSGVHILPGLLDSDYDETSAPGVAAQPPQIHQNGGGQLCMSSTLLSATPEPNSSSSDIGEHTPHKRVRRSSSRKKLNQRGGNNFDVFVNMMHTQPSEKKKLKRKRKKKHRSQSQPSKAIQDLMNEMDNSFGDTLKHVPIIYRSRDPLDDHNIEFEVDGFDTFADTFDSTKQITHELPGHNTKIYNKCVSGPSTPRVSKKKKKNTNHQRSVSLSTDKRTKALKLNDLALQMSTNSKRAVSNRNKSTNNKLKRQNSKLKKHKMDFNFYDISIRPNRRYRLIDGRIGIVKYKGKTVFAKGCETYIGILVEYGDGVHDGTVQGKSYFRCKDGKGDMIRPYQIIEDLGRFTNPITQQLIDDGELLIKDANKKLKQFVKKNNIKLPKK